MSRLGAVIAVAISSFTLACGGADPEPAAPPDPGGGSSTSPPVTDETPDDGEGTSEDGWSLAFSIVGRDTPMTARAELKITEGENDVHVSITGHTSGTDAMMIDLEFEGLDNALGSHREQFSLPDDGGHMANGSLDGNWYYSQGGTIEVNVSRDGNIQGRFEIDLALGEMGGPGTPVVFEATDEAVPMNGEFSGSWVLNCHSKLPGHATTIPGGDYCENLGL